MNSSKCYLQTIPKDILLLLLDNLDNHRYNLLKTCKHCYNTCHEVYNCKYRDDDMVNQAIAWYRQKEKHHLVRKMIFNPTPNLAIMKRIIKHYQYDLNFIEKTLKKLTYKNKFCFLSVIFSRVKNIDHYIMHHLTYLVTCVYRDKKTWRRKFKILIMTINFKTSIDIWEVHLGLIWHKFSSVNYAFKIDNELSSKYFNYE